MEYSAFVLFISGQNKVLILNTTVERATAPSRPHSCEYFFISRDEGTEGSQIASNNFDMRQRGHRLVKESGEYRSKFLLAL